jgi:hypothetical protein
MVCETFTSSRRPGRLQILPTVCCIHLKAVFVARIAIVNSSLIGSSFDNGTVPSIQPFCVVVAVFTHFDFAFCLSSLLSIPYFHPTTEVSNERDGLICGEMIETDVRERRAARIHHGSHGD